MVAVAWEAGVSSLVLQFWFTTFISSCTCMSWANFIAKVLWPGSLKAIADFSFAAPVIPNYHSLGL